MRESLNHRPGLSAAPVAAVMLVAGAILCGGASAQGRAIPADGNERDSSVLPSQMVPGSSVMKDVPYGPDPMQKIDVYLPPGVADAPILVMVHGGAWQIGDKAGQMVVRNKGSHWLSKGFIFVSVGYRLVPQADAMEQVADVGAALRAVQAQARSWGGDPGRIVMMGHSSGAHLVAMLSANPSVFAPGASRWSGSVLLDTAALDAEAIMSRPHQTFFDQAFGTDPAIWRRASPTMQLTSGAPPILLICSSLRRDSCPDAYAFATRAAAVNVYASVREEALSHRDINVSIGLPGPYTDAVDRFIDILTSKR